MNTKRIKTFSFDPPLYFTRGGVGWGRRGCPQPHFMSQKLTNMAFQKKKSPKGGVAVQMNDYLGKAAMYLKMYCLLKQCKLAGSLDGKPLNFLCYCNLNRREKKLLRGEHSSLTKF